MAHCGFVRGGLSDEIVVMAPAQVTGLDDEILSPSYRLRLVSRLLNLRPLDEMRRSRFPAISQGQFGARDLSWP